MSYSKMVRLTEILVNLTDFPINMYVEGDGSIRSFAPHRLDFRLPSSPERTKSVRIYYAVDADTLSWIKRSGRPLDDIALVVGKSRGRDDTEITSLVWAENFDIMIRPCVINSWCYHAS